MAARGGKGRGRHGAIVTHLASVVDRVLSEWNREEIAALVMAPI
jgi:hypothetical protein